MVKTLTTDQRHIDVRHLARKKMLVPGYRYSWEWRHPYTAELHAAIQVTVWDWGLTFSYRISNREQSRHVDQPVQLVTTPCHYGGHRYWFVCPCCGRQAALLYLGFRIACRRCNKMVYEVQREALHDRQCRKLDKIRERLGWEAGIFNGHGSKPKGMHWNTYWRLISEHDRLERPILGLLGKRCGLELSEYL